MHLNNTRRSLIALVAALSITPVLALAAGAAPNNSGPSGGTQGCKFSDGSTIKHGKTYRTKSGRTAICWNGSLCVDVGGAAKCVYSPAAYRPGQGSTLSGPTKVQARP